MRIAWHLSLYHLKKEKGRQVVFGFIILITALILHCSLMILFHVDSAYDAQLKELHTAHINLTTTYDNSYKTLQNQLREMEDIQEVEVKEGIFLKTTIKEFQGSDFEVNVMFYPYEDRSFNQWKLVEGTKSNQAHGIYVPLYMSAFGGYRIGDELTFDIGGDIYHFEILGVIEEMQYGNFSSTSIGVYLPLETYETFRSINEAHLALNYAVMMKDGVDHKEMAQTLATWIKHQNQTLLQTDSDELRKEARMMISELLIVILAVFACIILVVGLCLSNFKIKQTMEDELVNLGVCKAMGITSNELILSELISNILVTGCFAILGCGLSYWILPILCELIVIQAGFSLTLSFDFIPAVITVLCLTITSGGFTYLATYKLHSLQPINAIRKSPHRKRTHSALPLDQTIGNLHVLLMMKQILHNAKQTILLIGVMLLVSYLIAFAGILFYNGVVEPDNFTSSMVEETPTVVMNVSSQNYERIKQDLKQRAEVQQVLYYETMDASLNDLHTTMFVSEDFDKGDYDLCYKGRNPKEANEIAIGSAFLNQHPYKINDTVTITQGKYKQDYTITGFLQSVNYQGNIIELSEAGYKRLNEQAKPSSLYVYLQGETNVPAFISKMKAQYGSTILQIINTAQLNENAQSLYAQIIQIIITTLFLISIGIVLFILYVVMKSLLLQRKQELGILKAIGYSNRQLIMQISGSVLLPTLCAIILSIIIASFTLPLICDMMFQTIGIYQHLFVYPTLYLTGFGFTLWIITALFTICLARLIKRISPYALMTE